MHRCRYALIPSYYRFPVGRGIGFRPVLRSPQNRNTLGICRFAVAATPIMWHHPRLGARISARLLGRTRLTASLLLAGGGIGLEHGGVLGLGPTDRRDGPRRTNT